MKKLDSLKPLIDELKKSGTPATRNAAAQAEAAIKADAAHAPAAMLVAVRAQLTTLRTTLEAALATRTTIGAAEVEAQAAIETLKRAEAATATAPKDEKGIAALEGALRRALADAPKALSGLRSK